MIYWIIGILIIIVIMRKRILRFLGKVFGREKRREFKNKPITEKPLEPKPKPVQPKSFRIILKEGTDQTQSLQAQIDAIPDGTPGQPNIIQLPEGKFWTEGGENNPRGKNHIIRFVNRKHLIVKGNPDNYTVFFTKAPAVPYENSVRDNSHSLRRHFWIENCLYIQFNYIHVEGSNLIEGDLIGTTPELTPEFWKGGKDNGSGRGAPAYRAVWESEHAFDIRSSEDITIENCSINGVWGDAIYAGGSPSFPTKNLVVRNVNARFTGRQGFAAANCVDGLLLDGFNLEFGRRAAIDFEPHSDSGYVRNAEVKNCYLHTLQTAFAAIGRGDVSNINIHDNVYKTHGATIACWDSQFKSTRKNWIFKNNKREGGFGSPLAPIRFQMIEGVVIEDNYEPISKGQSETYVDVRNCKNVAVRRNETIYGSKIISLNSNVVSENNIPELEIIEL